MQSHASRFKRPTLLIVGCGDVGMRVLRLLRGRHRLLALTTHAERAALLRAAGAVPLVGNLDDSESIARLAGVADAVLHLAPPAPNGVTDTRTANLLRALARKGRVRRIVYASTTGVYGDCGGARFDETRPVNPATDRARRRVDRDEARTMLSPTQMSFMSESRRLRNDRLKKELRVRLRYPTVDSGLLPSTVSDSLGLAQGLHPVLGVHLERG